MGLYPGGGRGTSFITVLQISTECPLLDFLLIEELGRESSLCVVLYRGEGIGTSFIKVLQISTD